MKELVTTILTACPMRIRPQHDAPMSSQLLYGEEAEIQSINRWGWAKIKTMHDRHRGWTPMSQLIDSDDRQKQVPSICLDMVSSIFADDRSTLISLGSELMHFDGMTCRTGGKKFRFSGQAVQYKGLDLDGELIDKIGRKLLNAPHLPGGRTPFGVDPGGFVQLVYKCSGIKLPRTLGRQIEKGTSIDFIEYSKVGDLAYFHDGQGILHHVGIILADRKIIHVGERVRIDRFDHHGIFDVELQEYTHQLKIIKRYF